MKTTIEADMIMSHRNLSRSQLGFTLIELMATIAIVAIVASIAIPSYSKYILKNSESEVMSEIKQLEIQLEKWKASRLTYKGFIPNRGPDVCSGALDFCYDETDNKTIYTPKGSDASNHTYSITVVDGLQGNSLVSPNNTVIDLTSSRSWRILATPNVNGKANRGYSFMISSDGLQCKTKRTGLTYTSVDCGVHSTTEQW